MLQWDTGYNIVFIGIITDVAWTYIMFASILTSCHGTYIILRKLVYVFIYTKHMGTTNRSTTGLSKMQGPVLFSLCEREHFYPPESSCCQMGKISPHTYKCFQLRIRHQ